MISMLYLLEFLEGRLEDRRMLNLILRSSFLVTLIFFSLCIMVFISKVSEGNVLKLLVAV